MKAIATFSIVLDSDEVNGRLVDVRHNVKLYREDDGLIWRIDGEYGDECETLPRPKTVAEAKTNARAAYPWNSVWKMRENWN